VAGDAVPLPAAGDPIDPQLRIRARSASDDKGPIIAMLAALDAMKGQRLAPSVNVKFYLDGEEEAGNDHLGELRRAHKDSLRADGWRFFDGPMHVSGAPQIVTGVTGVDGTCYGPNRALHSGHYGNRAPNPAVAVTECVASIRDRNGLVRTANFYDDVPAIDAEDRAAARALSVTDDSVRTSLGLGTEAKNAPPEVRIMMPALNVRGIRAGGVGAGATNPAPTPASVSIDFRLVPNQQPARLRQLLAAHLASPGYTIVPDPDPDPDAAARSKDRSHMAGVR